MRIIWFCLIAVLNLLASSAVKADSQPSVEPRSIWNLPQALSPSNSEISFELDTTWHMVEARIKEIEGNVWLSDPADYRSVRATLSLPVKSFDTDNSTRDEKMYRVMAEDRFPLVKFNLTQVHNICEPQKMEQDFICDIEIEGMVIIRGIERAMKFPAKLSKVDSHYQISGTTSLNWKDFEVEDPSILIAKVQEVVQISILLKL